MTSTTYLDDESQSAKVIVNRTGDTTGVTTATFNTSSAGAAVVGATCATGVDVQDATQILTFAAGETSKDVLIPLCGDVLADPNETVNLTLTGLSSGADLGTRGSAVLTIIDTANQFRNATPISIHPRDLRESIPIEHLGRGCTIERLPYQDHVV